MKKILVIITTAFVEFGGLTTVMMNYYRNMEKNGLRIDFASTNAIDSTLNTELKDNGSQYYNLGPRNSNPIKYAHNLDRLLKGGDYDVVHVNANSATVSLELSVACKNNVPCKIVHIHNSIGNHKYMHKILQPVLFHLCDVFLACSEKAGHWAYNDREFEVLNNAVDTKKYSFDQGRRKLIREKIAVTEDAFVIGHVGKINEQKNHGFLLEVFNEFHKRYANSYLLLVGDGALRETIEVKAKDLGLIDNVIFAGMCSNVCDYLTAMDCFVFPSLWEGLPLSLIEAQSSGLPCVVSSNITQESNVTQKVIYLSVDENTRIWSDKIYETMNQDRLSESQDNIERIKNNGFDIYENACALRKIYLG